MALRYSEPSRGVSGWRAPQLASRSIRRHIVSAAKEEAQPSELPPPKTPTGRVDSAAPCLPPASSLEEIKDRRTWGIHSLRWTAAVTAWNHLCCGTHSDRRSHLRSRKLLSPKLLLAWLAVAMLMLAYRVCKGQVGWGEYPHTPVVWPAREPRRKAQLKPLVTMDRSPDSCAQALGIPKVALLFLTLGHMPHELTWHHWLRAAEGQLPLAAVQQAGFCSSPAGGDEGRAVGSGAAEACAVRQLQEGSPAARGILARQHLFSIYTHVPPGFQGFPASSLFAGTVIAEQIPTRWGTHTLVEATRELLGAAAVDPANQRFVLLSESDLPLYDPLTFYQQLQSESRSRVNACPAPKGASKWAECIWRWTPSMQFNSSYWRKSSQFFVLTRRHAEAVLADTQVFRAFETYCWSGWVPEFQRQKDCFSDEHYLPTLLALRGLEGECACEAWNGPSYMEWEAGKPHPRTFMRGDIGADLIRRARSGWRQCQAEAAQEAAWRMFVHRDELAGSSRLKLCRDLGNSWLPTYDHALPPSCAVTARKFHASAARAVRALFTGCEGMRLGLLGSAGSSYDWGCKLRVG